MAILASIKVVGPSLVFLGLLAGAAYWIDGNREAARIEAKQKGDLDRKFELELSVSVLPPGTEEAWLAYVDRRIAKTMIRRGNALEILPLDGNGDYREIVSLNSPYKITCLSGVMVEFGFGDDKTTMLVFSFASDYDQPPSLGVNMQSVAANNLAQTLCSRASDRIGALMSTSK